MVGGHYELNYIINFVVTVPKIFVRRATIAFNNFIETSMFVIVNRARMKFSMVNGTEVKIKMNREEFERQFHWIANFTPGTHATLCYE